MRYHYLQGISNKQKKRKFGKLLLVLPVVGLLAGGYLLLNSFAPMLPLDDKPKATAERLVQTKPNDKQNRLYIPQLNVDVAIAEGDSAATLELGAWHRKPENGDPASGGNFVLSAHRFLLGVTPWETRAKSPFYHIDKLKQGDEVYVDWQGTRFVYKVQRKYDVARTAVEIEAPSKDSKLTLYSCDLRGEAAGREVIEAEPAGTIAWTGGKPFIKPEQAN